VTGRFWLSCVAAAVLDLGLPIRFGWRRGADDPKNAHLWALDGAAERLTMLQVDLLDRDSLRAAFHGCHGVIHTASPMHDNPVSARRPPPMIRPRLSLDTIRAQGLKLIFFPSFLPRWQEEIIEPIIAGTRNVVEAAADAGVRRLVLSSTIGTMYMDPRRDPDAPLGDSSWSDLEYCKSTQVDGIDSSPPRISPANHLQKKSLPSPDAVGTRRTGTATRRRSRSRARGRQRARGGWTWRWSSRWWCSASCCSPA
jgi:cinnamoyl-CoA reductase